MNTTPGARPSSAQSQSATIAVVTGASRGIGAAIAQRLAADGFVVAVHYRQDSDAAAAVVDKITSEGGRAFALSADLADPGIGTAFWSAYDAAAGPDGDLPIHTLVSNAGVTLRGHIESFPADQFALQQQINATAPFLITQAALPRLVDGGRIINVSSVVTRVAFPDIIGYAMTKGAIDALTLNLAQHLGPRNITVNAVAPGLVDTDMNAGWLRGNPEAIAGAAQLIALGRVAAPEDVADVVAFLASDDARFVTGQVIDASGGARL